jgi:hypothetical protein
MGERDAMSAEAPDSRFLRVIRRSRGRWDWLRGIPRVLIALFAAGALVALLWRFIPTRLDVTTNALGYPTRFNFNVFRQWYIYGLLVFMFPGSTLCAYAALRRLRPRFPRRVEKPATGLPAREAQDGSTPLRATPIEVAIRHGFRLVGVGLVLGLETTVPLRNRAVSTVAVFLGTAVAYPLAVALLALAARRWRQSRLDFGSTLSLFNGIGTIACVLGLYAVSRATQVAVATLHVVRTVPWLPSWMTVVFVASGLVGLALFLRHARTAERIWTAERWMILIVAVPAAFVALHAHVPGELGVYNSFEDGQLLVGAQQLLHGAFPWRDIILTHGIFGDSVVFMPGLAFFEVSRWGAWAGYYLLVEPLYWLVIYGLVLYLTRARWTYGLLFLTIVVLDTSFLNGFLSQVSARLLPLPLVLGAFVFLLRRPTWPRAAAFSGSLLALVVVTPETLVFVAAFVGVLVVFELYGRDTARPIGLATFPRLFRCAVSAIAWMLVLVAWLAMNNALDGFIFYFKTFVPAHILEGIPILNSDQLFFKAGMYVPVSVALLYLAAMVTAMFTRHRPRLEDWIGSVLAVGVVLYYAKFLGRPDGEHLAQFLAFTTPFLVYVAYRVVDSAGSWLADRHWRSPLSAAFGTYAVAGALVLGLLVPSVGDLVDAAQNAPAHFRVTVQSAPTVPQVGYSVPGIVAPDEFTDLRKLIGVLGGRRPRVWDFSNAPADIYFFAQFKLLTRYYHVSPAIEPATQQDVVSELKQANPDVVVYNSATGLTTWDGLPNMVRHYYVSAWILRNYRPAVVYAGFLLFVRKSNRVSSTSLSSLQLSAPIELSNLYTDSVGPCDWGYVPNFFAQHPASDSASQPVALQGLGQHVITKGRLAASQDLRYTPVEVFMTEAGVRIGTGRIAPNLSLFASGVGYGFEIDATIASDRSASELATWMRTADGTIAPLPGPGQRPAPDIGTIEGQNTVWEDRLTLPPNSDTFHWLELTNSSGSAIRPDSFALSLVNEQTHGIYFSTRAGAPTPFAVRLDNCSQWAAMPGAPVVLTHTQKQTGLELRLRG